MNGIDCPVKITDIAKFERQNTNISVNVFGLDGTKIFPLRITTIKDAPHHVNLLYVAKDEKSHYILVRDLNRLAGQQLNKHCSKKFLCNYCLHGCSSKKIYEMHVEKCRFLCASSKGKVANTM